MQHVLYVYLYVFFSRMCCICVVFKNNHCWCAYANVYMLSLGVCGV